MSHTMKLVVNNEPTDADLIIIRGGSYDDCVYTRKEYKEIRLQMSTGDFHVHTIQPYRRRAKQPKLTLIKGE